MISVAPPKRLIAEPDQEIQGIATLKPSSPGRPWSELLIALAVFAGALGYLWPLRSYLSFNADEGITLVSAERILRGQVPYRDFFIFITPGSAYLTALWFKLFGTSYLVPRSILLLYAGVFGATTYWLARRSCSRRAALFAAGMVVFGCMPCRFFVLHNWDSTLFALLAICCALSLLDRPSRTVWFLLGGATAFTFLMEQSKGAGLALGLTIAGLYLVLSGRGWASFRIGSLLWCTAGFAIPLMATFAYFGSQHATKEMLEAWFWPLQHYSGVNHVAYGAVPMSSAELRDMYFSGPWGERLLSIGFSAPMFLVSLLALLVLAATFYEIATHWSGTWARSLDRRRVDRQIVGGCIYLGIFLSTVATGRADVSHVVYLTPLFMYLLPSIVEIDYRGSRLFRGASPIVAGLLLFLFAGFGMATILRATAPAARMESRRGSVKLGYPDEVLAYVQEQVPAGQHLYVHPYQAAYSFMTATVNPARVSFLQAGMNPPAQYEATVGDLARDRPAYVLLNPDFADKIFATWPATSAETLATDPVEDYILQHYRTCHLLNANPPQLWKFYFMVRKDLRCSGN
jgi:hypothetical protein